MEPLLEINHINYDHAAHRAALSAGGYGGSTDEFLKTIAHDRPGAKKHTELYILRLKLSFVGFSFYG